MGRKPRVHYAGALYHAIVRGNNRESIFRSQIDYSRFEGLIEEGIQRFSHQIHAYCWMTNHAHMVVKVEERSLSEILHNLCFRYASWFNNRYSRTGHLFERRFRAGLIQTEESIRRVVRYIHLNPVRAGMVSEPLDYRWSSHAPHLERKECRWLSRSLVKEVFGKSRIDLEAYISIAPDEESDSEFPQDFADLLDNRMSANQEEIGARPDVTALPPVPTWRLARPIEVMQVVAKEKGLEVTDLIGGCRRKEVRQARAIASYLGSRCDDVSIAEMARELNRDPTTVSRGARGLARRLDQDEPLRVEVEEITTRLAEILKQQHTDSSS